MKARRTWAEKSKRLESTATRRPHMRARPYQRGAASARKRKTLCGRSSRRLQPALPPHAFVAGIAGQTAHQRIDQETEQSGIMIIVGNLQPLEGPVRFAAPSVNLSNLVRQQVSVIGNHVGQRRVRGHSIPSRVIRKREFETMIAFV